MSKRILLIDLSALFHPAWRANENGPVSVAYEGTLGGVRRCISIVNPDATAICCDGRGNWRKELDAGYKAHRDPLPSVFYAELDRVKQRLRDDGLLLWECPGFEADDVIATAVAAVQRGEPSLTTVATHDKDLLQLVIGDNQFGCNYLSLSTFELRDTAAVVGKYGISPELLGDWLALVGDASDGVKGAPGIGPKTATKLLQQYGDLLGVFKAAYDLKSDMTPAIRKSLTENGPQIELARKLVTLRTDAPIKFEEIWEKREVKPLTEVEAAREDAADMISAGPSEPPQVPPPEVASEIVRSASTELVTVEYSKALEPRSFRDALICCKVLFNSRLYQKYKSPEAMAAVVLRGREMGYGAGASLDGFHVIEQTGQLAMHAHMIIDRAMQHPDFDYLDCLETDDKHAIYEGKRKSSSRSFKLEYTIDQAKAAGLVRSRSNWELRPTEQLRKTCGVQVCRVLWPGAAMGLYSMVEMGQDE